MKFLMNREIFKVDKMILILILLLAAALRLPYLDKFPPALYSDEVSQGYNAYSILKTGRDEYGTLFPVSIRSFGDWKPPLQTYLMMPTIAVFGLNPWGVRLPSAILGCLTVWVFFYLVKEIQYTFIIGDKTKTTVNSLVIGKRLFKENNLISFWNKNDSTIALLSALFLAISPWHILFSRSAMLVGVALFFFTLGVLGLLKGFRLAGWWLVSAVSFTLSFYAYYGMRVSTPLLLIFLFILFFRQLKNRLPQTFPGIILGILMLLPIILGFMKQPDVVFGRAKTVSIFYDQGISLTVWDLIAQDGMYMPSWLVKFYHNKPVLYLKDISRRFFQHLDGRFLFLSGDKHPPFLLPGMGVLYLIDAFFICLGIVYIIKHHPKLHQFLLLWIIAGIMPAALTFVTPSANRTLPVVIPLMMINAIGILFLLTKIKNKKIKILILSLISLAYLIFLSNFLHVYTVVIPQQYSQQWHDGYQELVEYLNTQADAYERIVVPGKISVPYIFVLFYNQVDPKIAQAKIIHNYRMDEYGFENVDSFEKYEFPRYFDWSADKDTLTRKSLLVTRAEDAINDRKVQKIKQINYPNGQPAFDIYAIE